MPLYVYVKSSFIFDGDVDIMLTVRSTIKLIIVYAFVKYLSMNKKTFKKGIISMLIMGGLISLSMYIPEVFQRFGFKVLQWESFGGLHEPDRYAGISGLNVNAAGTLLATLFGATLFMLQEKFLTPKYVFIFASLFLVGIFMTASRTAFFISLTLYGIYLIKNSAHFDLPKILLNIFASLVLLVVFNTFGDSVISRIESQQDVGYGGLGARIGYWELYAKDLIENPHYLIMGNTARSTYERSPHNNYIWISFHAGALFLIAALFFVLRALHERRKIVKQYSFKSMEPLYVALPIFMYWITGTYVISWFGLILMMSVGIYMTKNKEIVEFK